MGDELTIRPAQPDDRPAMERICSHTWDWGDYIPEVWDDWLADEHGLVLVGELGEQVVALSKITFHTPDQVWLEGMRVEPGFRRQGIAGRFLEYSVAYAGKRGARVVRLGTGSNNTPVHVIAARAGLERVGTYALWTAEPLPGATRPTFLTVSHAAQVQAFLQDDLLLAHVHGLYSVDWAWQELTADRAAHFLESGQVTAQLAPDGALVALATIHPEPEGDGLWVGFADGQPEAITNLAVEIRAHAAQLGAQKVKIMLPDVDWLQDAFCAAGYGFGDRQDELWIFEWRRP